MNLKDKWSKFKLKLDNLPISKWLLVIITFISVVVAIASFVSKRPNNEQYSTEESTQEDYGVMLTEYEMKANRLIRLIRDARKASKDVFAPFDYANQIQALAAECEKLGRSLNDAPLNSRQKLYKEQTEAKLEDALRRFKWN